MDPNIGVDEFRDAASAFIEQSVAAGIACPEFGAIMPPAMLEQARTWQQHCFAHGFTGIHWPAAHGGLGLGQAHAAAWSELCAVHQVAPYMNFQGYVLAGGAIIAFGTDDQKARWLRPTLAAETLWCQLFSEPGSGSDLVSLSTRADPDGDGGWIINGQKVWSSTAQFADMAILLARTNPDEPGHRGISFFLFDMRQDGVDVRPITQMTGDQEFCEVFLTDAHVGADGLLGELHTGWTVATSVLADERSSVGAAGVAMRHRLAELAQRCSGGDGEPGLSARSLALLTTGHATEKMLARSGGAPLLGPLAKLALTEHQSASANLAVDQLGPGGMLGGAEIDAFLYAPGMRIAGGTSEIQRNLIGERLLGLPREPRPR